MSASKQTGQTDQGHQTRRLSLVGRYLAASIVGSLMLAIHAGSAWADVTLYDQAPSAEELEQKLLGNGKAGKKKFKTRAIVFGDAAEEATDAVASVNAPAEATASHASSAAAPAASSMQVSEEAIAFPIQFNLNSAQILPDSVPFLQSVASLMQKNADLRLLIEGHTDISGDYQRNMTLSRERASAVMNYLISHFGIHASRLHTVGKGPTDLLQNLEPTNPKHRRVQFRVVG